MSTTMPGPGHNEVLRTIGDSLAAFRDRISRSRPAAPDSDRVKRYLRTGQASAD